MEMQKNGWGYLCEKSKKERKEILRQYAESYVEPAFEGYPELKGKIYLALRKNGFIAEYNPVYYIIVPENALNRYGHHVLRAITAHEMGHLLQFQNDIGKDSQSLWSEIQATMLSWERGFAKDFLLAFPENCTRSVCDGKEKHCYFSCNLLFDGCCRMLLLPLHTPMHPQHPAQSWSNMRNKHLPPDICPFRLSGRCFRILCPGIFRPLR